MRNPQPNMSRRARRSSPVAPLGPTAFARRLPHEIGTSRGKRLVREAMNVVQATGKPDAWIREVRRARDRAAITPAAARFLIFKFAESAITALIDTHPRLAPITAEMDRIEREHGLQEDEFWYVHEAPPEWRALSRAWDAVVDEIMAETFLRHDELELAANVEVRDDPLFDEGRHLFFPPDADAPRLPNAGATGGD